MEAKWVEAKWVEAKCMEAKCVEAKCAANSTTRHAYSKLEFLRRGSNKDAGRRCINDA